MANPEHIAILQQGVEEWNRWRKVLDKHFVLRPDLSEANLSHANLSEVDLAGVSLIAAHLSAADLSGADLSQANLGRANIRGAKLLGVDLSEANLTDADLRGTDLSPNFSSRGLARSRSIWHKHLWKQMFVSRKGAALAYDTV